VDREAEYQQRQRISDEAADRLENVLSSAPPFEAAAVSGQISKNKGGAVSFGINIPLEADEDAR
jgi:hypothetical protein